MSQAPTQKLGNDYVPPDVDGMKELLEVMNSTLSTLSHTIDNLKDQSHRVATLGPQMDSAHQIHQLRRAMRAQEKKQDIRVNDLTHLIKDVLKEEVAQMLEAEIDNLVEEEVRLQTEEQVRLQLIELRVSGLEEQVTEGGDQEKAAGIALVNSDARKTNSKLRASNQDDQIAIMLRSDGEESAVFPQDLGTLFSYDHATLKNLVSDYGLPESDQREANLNAFMAFAGIQFHLVPVPATPMHEGGSAANALGIAM